MMKKIKKKYEAVVIGAGHAGVEAALALSRKGHDTLLVTLDYNAISFLACNPSIGGTAKGQLVSEIDALGGQMGISADSTLLQIRMLNESKGPAVHSLSAQVDKNKYHRFMQDVLEGQQNLTLIEDEVVEISAVDGLPPKGRCNWASDPASSPSFRQAPQSAGRRRPPSGAPGSAFFSFSYRFSSCGIPQIPSV